MFKIVFAIAVLLLSCSKHENSVGVADAKIENRGRDKSVDEILELLEEIRKVNAEMPINLGELRERHFSSSEIVENQSELEKEVLEILEREGVSEDELKANIEARELTKTTLLKLRAELEVILDNAGGPGKNGKVRSD